MFFVASRLVPVLLTLAVILGGAASCGDESAADDCIDKAADAYNSTDLSGLTPADGFSEEEYELFTDRVEARLDADPALAEGGRCRLELDGKVPPELGQQLDPEFQKALTAHGDAFAAELNGGSS